VVAEAEDGRVAVEQVRATRPDVVLLDIRIAGRLFVVEGTVKAYVSTILNRLGARNRVQAAITAYEAGLVGGEPEASNR
jgi:DNA-binding NarL/FixJ family response regulator